MTEHVSPNTPEDAGAEAAKDQPRRENPPADGGQEIADTSKMTLRLVELRKGIDAAIEKGDDPDPEDVAELADILSELRDNKKQVFLEQDVLRELMPKRKRLSDKALALALGVDTTTLRNWRKTGWYKGSIERVRREWRRKLDILPLSHPLGIGLELEAIINKEDTSDTDRLKAVQMAATILPGMVPVDMRQEEEEAPDILIGKLKKAILLKVKEHRERKDQEAEAEQKAQEKDQEAVPDQP